MVGARVGQVEVVYRGIADVVEVEHHVGAVEVKTHFGEAAAIFDLDVAARGGVADVEVAHVVEAHASAAGVGGDGHVAERVAAHQNAAREGACRDVAKIEGTSCSINAAVGDGVVLHCVVLAAAAVDAPVTVVGFAIFDGDALVVRAVGDHDTIRIAGAGGGFGAIHIVHRHVVHIGEIQGAVAVVVAPHTLVEAAVVFQHEVGVQYGGIADEQVAHIADGHPSMEIGCSEGVATGQNTAGEAARNDVAQFKSRTAVAAAHHIVARDGVVAPVVHPDAAPAVAGVAVEDGDIRVRSGVGHADTE